MKVPSEDLFRLVQSLSRGEKLFFRKHALSRKTTGGRGYLKLFDLLSKASVYNEPFLIDKLGYSGNRAAFSVLKNYLFNELMNALVQFNQENIPGIQTLVLVQQLDVLAEKGLLDQYLKLWRKSYKEAAATEQFQLLFMLRDQLHNLKMNFILKTNHAELRNMISAGEDFAGEYTRLQRLKNFYLQVQLYNKQSQIRLRKTETGELEMLLKEPVIGSLPAGSSFHYRYYYNMCRAVLLYLTHDYEKALVHVNDCRADLLKHRLIIKNNPYLCLEFISVFYMVSFLCRQYDSFFAFLDHPMVKMLKSDTHTAFLFAYHSNSYLRYYMTRGLYKEAAAHLARVEAGIEPHYSNIPLEIRQLLMGSMGISYFILGKYNEAFFRTRECMKTFHDHPREDLQRYVYPLCIVIAYEMKNLRLLVSECDNAYQFFYRKKMMTPFEETFISFFRKMPRVHGRKETREKFTEFRQQLETFRKDPVMGQVFRYFNFYGWAESKELGISYMEYVQQQVKS